MMASNPTDVQQGYPGPLPEVLGLQPLISVRSIGLGLIGFKEVENFGEQNSVPEAPEALTN